MSAVMSRKRLKIDEVVGRFRMRGWTPRDTQELSPSQGGRTYVHIVSPSFGVKAKIPNAHNFWPQIILCDYHEGSRAIVGRASIFDVMGDTSFVVPPTASQILERDADEGAADALVGALMDGFGDVFALKREMSETVLTLSQRAKFAEGAMELRAIPDRTTDPKQLIDDPTNFNLWGLLVKFQRILFAGDFFFYRDEQSFRKAPNLRAVDEQIRVSEGLWGLAADLIC
jgi:hypothetical protein